MANQFQPRFRPGLPPPAKRWSGFPPYNFVGGHNDADQVPVERLIAAATDVLAREGKSLATYGLQSGPQGYYPLRAFIAAELVARTGMRCAADDILLTSGSLQALDLVFEAFLQAGDSVVMEEASYGGVLSRLNRLGVNCVGVEVDQDGMRMDRLSAILDDLAGQERPPKFIYTIPTVQNPTGTVMSEARRIELLGLAKKHDLPIFEDDCYADLLWDGDRPPSIRALDMNGAGDAGGDAGGRVIYCGSFSKTVAPALRVGYLVADWPILSQALALKTDAGSGALEQMVLAEFATAHFGDHVVALAAVLKEKYETMALALEAQFGTQVEFSAPKGGIFLWVTFPETVDTTRLAQVALEAGVEINPGAEWSADPEHGRHRARLCFGSASKQEITDGIARLADICYRETGIPARSANVVR
jgi:2-aminoadipate transaminase